MGCHGDRLLRDIEAARFETISFEDGLEIDPETGETTPIAVTDRLVGVFPVELVEGGQERQIGTSMIFQFALVVDENLNPLTDDSVVAVEFLANRGSAGSRIPRDGFVEYILSDPDIFTHINPGFESLLDDSTRVAWRDGAAAVFGTAEYGLRVRVADGYNLVVRAGSAVTGDWLEVDETVGALAAAAAESGALSREYRVAPQEVGGPLSAVIWIIGVERTDGPVNPGTDPTPASAGQTRLPATGSAIDPLAWMLAASALVGAGIVVRLVTRRRRG